MPDPSVAIYQWLTSPEFLIHSIMPGGAVVEASVEDSAESVCAAIPRSCRLFVFHLNCTQTGLFPLARKELLDALGKRGLTALNRRATDISKRNIQRICANLALPMTLARPEGDPDETIIVKTNLNFGGDSEWALTQEQRTRMGIARGTELIWKPHQYMVIPRREVAAEWWDDENLICERFIQNRNGRCYRAYLLLDRIVLCQLTNPNDIKKMDASTLENMWRIERSGSEASGESGWPRALVADLLQFVEAFGLDFGTVDFVEDESQKFYLIDVNTTPGYRIRMPGLTDFLTEGIESLAAKLA